MANNRMFLIHKQAKIGIMLGRRMALGWYSRGEESELNRFYEYVSNELNFDVDNLNQDDFVLAMEDCTDSTCFNDFEYTTEKVAGFRVFKIKGK